jgi:hypothetical protein
MTTPEAPANEAPIDDQGERLRRDEPARTEPNRQTASVFLPSAGETVDAGVNTAYKVFGDYLRRGQEAAQKQNGGDGRQNPWAVPGTPWATNMTMIPLQVFRAWAQLASTWAELSMLPGASEGVRQMAKLVEDFWSMAGVSADATTEASATPQAAASASALRFAVETSSAQPVEVDVEFDPPAGVVPMIQRLHPLRGEAPPLTALELEIDASTGRVKLSIAIPSGQPPGRYVGTIFDDRNDRACGSVKVRVGG